MKKGIGEENSRFPLKRLCVDYDFWTFLKLGYNGFQTNFAGLAIGFALYARFRGCNVFQTNFKRFQVVVSF